VFSHHASSSSSGHYRLAVETRWFRTLLPKIAHHTGLKGLWIHDNPALKDTLWSRPIRATWNLIQTPSLPSRRCLEGLDPQKSRTFWVSLGGRFTVYESSSQQHLSYLKISKSLGFQPPTVRNPQYWNTLTSRGSQLGLGSIQVSGMNPRDRSGLHRPSETEPIVCTLPSLQLFGSWAPNLLKSSGSIWN
jgi:hypothetical protein